MLCCTLTFATYFCSMKISTKNIIIVLGILIAGNGFAYFKYGNTQPYYEYELVLKSKALLYDQLQQLCRKITSTTFPEHDRFLSLSDLEKENIKSISYTSFKEEDYYVFSLKRAGATGTTADGASAPRSKCGGHGRRARGAADADGRRQAARQSGGGSRPPPAGRFDASAGRQRIPGLRGRGRARLHAA